VVDLNLLELYREHLANDSITTIGLISIDDPTGYGIAEIDADCRIKRFREKPVPGRSSRTWQAPEYMPATRRYSITSRQGRSLTLPGTFFQP